MMTATFDRFRRTVEDGLVFVDKGDYGNAWICYQSAQRKADDSGFSGEYRTKAILKVLKEATDNLFCSLKREPAKVRKRKIAIMKKLKASATDKCADQPKDDNSAMSVVRAQVSYTIAGNDGQDRKPDYNGWEEIEDAYPG